MKNSKQNTKLVVKNKTKTKHNTLSSAYQRHNNSKEKKPISLSDKHKKEEEREK